MHRNELLKKFPNASEAFLRANEDPIAGAIPDPQPQRAVRRKRAGSDSREEKGPGRAPLRLTIVSRRVRLLDPDNPCPKFLIDALRYEGLIPNDTSADIILEVRQEQVGCEAEEETIVTIEPELAACTMAVRS